MAFDAHKNFAYSTIATAPAPAASGTSLVVAAGDGTKFPAVPFNATIWPINTQPTTANAEVVRVTNITTDTLTITRGQESSAARTVIVGDQIAATITAKTLTDVETVTAPNPGTSGAIPYYSSTTTVASSALLAANAPVIGGGAGVAPTTITAGILGQVLAGSGAAPSFLGGATLLRAATGTDATVGATTVDSIVLPALTAKDSLLILFEVESVTQNTGQWILYSVTDGVSIGLLSPSPLTAGNSSMGITMLMERQGNTTSIMQFMANWSTAGAALAGNGQYAAVTATWLSGWTLGLRHGGVTAGGTAKYTWAVYRMAGQ